VVSSLGKGIAAASLGLLLKARGLRVTLMKLDPYLNVDPGTMSPFQHGEVFVTDDGAETDLDLGHYERFTNTSVTRSHNVTAGQVYDTILSKERRGDYLGRTVQVIPHVTDEIKRRITNLALTSQADVAIIEIGGTVGDIESLPFLEAVRQLRLELRRDTLFVHVTLVPFLKVAGEVKTKPTQHSVRELREIGIQPDLLLCRSEVELDSEVREKIALFCNVPTEAVIGATDKPSIYEVPLMFHEGGLDSLVVQGLGLDTDAPDLRAWVDFVSRVQGPERECEIAVVGKYTHVRDAYKSIMEAFVHAGAANRARVRLRWLEAGDLETTGVAERLQDVDGVLVPGGFGERGIEGKIEAARFARERGIPYFGLCLGMQVATIEFARHVAGWQEAHSSEFDPACW
jgi:CTP synthase